MTTANSSVIARVAEHIQARFLTDSSGHDWYHIDRVRKPALQIARQEGANLAVVELAALLNDIADWKFHGGDDSRGQRRPSCCCGRRGPVMLTSAEAYKAAKGTSLNHFYEKLFLLKGLMNTASGRALAEERHRYMEQFVGRFWAEWHGDTAAT